MNPTRFFRVAVKHGRSHFTLPLAHALLGQSDQAVFIVAYPRSGSTLLRTILTNILIPEAGGDPRIFNKQIPGVSLRRLLLARKAATNNPAIIHSHTKYFKGMRKVLYLVRNGGDAIASLYHYTTTRNNDVIDFHTWFKLYKKGLYGPRWHAHVESWLKRGKSNLGKNLFLIRFEDMKQDPCTWVAKAANFLGVKASQQEIIRAIEDATIEKAKRWERRLLGQPKTPDASFYRGGSIGQWRDYFSEKDLESFMAMSAHALSLAGYSMRK